MATKSKGKGQKMLVLLLMIISMCTIYVLPYLRYQFFTPLQEAMGLAGETQKYGNLVTVYGVMNILMYLPGGIIADRFNPKKLMVFSMISSGVLGLWMATWPGYEMLLLIHILWGFTTVLTFWATSVKVVNMLASSDEQGTMFGMLESGRGIVNMLLNFAWVGVLAMFVNRGTLGMTVVVAAVSILMIISGVLLGFLLPPMDVDETSNGSIKDSIKSLFGAFKLPITYVLAAMIFVPSAISATGSYYAPYLETVAGLDTVTSSTFSVVRSTVVPVVAALACTMVVKKMGRSSRLLLWSCVVLIALAVALRVMPGAANIPVAAHDPDVSDLILHNCCRAVNWALIDEAGTAKIIVGSVTGIASLIGYLPDSFIHTMYGGWIDNYDFTTAYNKIFNFCIIVVVVGTLFALLGERIIKKRQAELKTEASAPAEN